MMKRRSSEYPWLSLYLASSSSILSQLCYPFQWRLDRKDDSDCFGNGMNSFWLYLLILDKGYWYLKKGFAKERFSIFREIFRFCHSLHNTISSLESKHSGWKHFNLSFMFWWSFFAVEKDEESFFPVICTFFLFEFNIMNSIFYLTKKGIFLRL